MPQITPRQEFIKSKNIISIELILQINRNVDAEQKGRKEGRTRNDVENNERCFIE